MKPRATTQAPQLKDIHHLDDINLEVPPKADGLLSPSTSATLNEEDSVSPVPADLFTPGPQCPSITDTGHRALLNADPPPLDAQDLQLLTHYLTHTSQTIPYDKADLYALHIGIPNLAFTSKPLMGSVLALAAVCQCYDLLPTVFVPTHDDESPSSSSLFRIQKLLALAESHHRSSLSQINEAIGTERFDTVLANATLMTLYGNAVHCVRIRLIQLYSNKEECNMLGRPIPSEFVPAQSHWISVIRAAHCAFVGLRAEVETECDFEIRASPSSGLLKLLQQEAEGESDLTRGVGEVKCAQDGPAESTRRLFQPIVTATIGGAMDKLRKRVRRTREEINNVTNVETRSCTGALEILESIISETLPGIIINRTSNQTASSPDTHDEVSMGRLSLVAPWLRAYTARVTSNSGLNNEMPGSSLPSHPMRRKITSFLNRVDADYLSFVQEMLEHMTLPELGETIGPGCRGEDSAESQIALDIFAHWLVLMCLLDGVWWIGGIGMWELGRVVNYIEGSGRQEIGQQMGEAWWPGSMYRIRLELAKQQV